MSNQNKSSVGVLGAGNWGTVVALLASRQAETVYLYDREIERVKEINQIHENKRYLEGITLPQNIRATHLLEEVFSNCQLVLPIIPSSVFREFTQKFARYTCGDHFIVHGTKGLEPGTHKRMSEILYEETGTLRIGVLSGPNLALELARGQPAGTVVASRFEEVTLAAQKGLASSQVRIYGSHDVVGVEWAGALKNILAIACGMLAASGFGQNAQALLLTRGLFEIGRLIEAMGAHSSTLIGLAGIGDMIATCTSPLSRNYRCGKLLIEGAAAEGVSQKLGMVVEGLNTIKVAYELSRDKKLDMPITQGLYEIVFQGKPPQKALEELMERPASFEF